MKMFTAFKHFLGEFPILNNITVDIVGNIQSYNDLDKPN